MRATSFLDKCLVTPAQDGPPSWQGKCEPDHTGRAFLVSPWRNIMRRLTWAAAAAATVAITLSAPGAQSAALAASMVKTPLVASSVVCPRLVRPTCPKYYTAACIQHGRGAAFRCCAKMG